MHVYMYVIFICSQCLQIYIFKNNYIARNIYSHKVLVKTDLKLLNFETASIYLKVSDFKKTYHHFDKFHFKTFSKVRKANFNFLEKRSCAYIKEFKMKH